MATAGAPAASTSEAIPAIGCRWETVSFQVPKLKLYAVPKPQRGPSLVGIPILAGAAFAPQMGMPMMAGGVPPAPAGRPEAPAGEPDDSTTAGNDDRATCQEGCCSSDNMSRDQILQQCENLSEEITHLSQTIGIEAGGGKGVRVGVEQKGGF